jgi:glycerol-3-phosphate acyltransferase PlsY
MELSGLLNLLGFGLFGYLCGSLAFAVWVTRWIKGVDVRQIGSQHATATNVVRQAGWWVGALVMLLDIAKGSLPVFLAVRYGVSPWAVPVAAAMAVTGHCWPLFANFKGGMGLAAAGGAFLAVYPLAFPTGLVTLVALLLLLRHAARAGLVAGLAVPVVFWTLDFPAQVTMTAASAGLIISLRYLRDWNRTYSELWLDRGNKST